MTKPTGNTMKVLRRIFGVPLAFAITVGAMFLVAWQGSLRVQFHNFYLYMVLTELEIVIIFALPVFLSCLFVPSPKKHVGLIAVVIVNIFVIVIVYYLFVQIIEEGYNSFTVENVAAYLAFIAGSAIGYAVSYVVFKNKGWNRELPAAEMGEDY